MCLAVVELWNYESYLGCTLAWLVGMSRSADHRLVPPLFLEISSAASACFRISNQNLVFQLVMGRHDLRPLRVHSTAKKLLTADRISNLPSWHSVIDSIPPAQTLVRTQRIQHAKQRKTQKPKAQKIGKIFQPSRIAYEEDKLRKKFFGDHPWELARPRLVLESDGRDYEKNDWSRLPQTGRSANGER